LHNPPLLVIHLVESDDHTVCGIGDGNLPVVPALAAHHQPGFFGIPFCPLDLEIIGHDES